MWDPITACPAMELPLATMLLSPIWQSWATWVVVMSRLRRPIVVQDVPPYTMVQGDRAVPVGLNTVGLKRAGFSTEAIKDIKSMYRLLYNESLTVEDCIKRIETEVPESDHRRLFVGFLRSSERGVCR